MVEAFEERVGDTEVRRGVLSADAVTADLVRGLVLEDPARPIAPRPPPPGFLEHQERFLDAMLTPEPEIRRTRAETTWSEAEIQAWAACKPQVDRRLIHHLCLGPDRWRDLIGGVAVPTLLVVPARPRRWGSDRQRRGHDRPHLPRPPGHAGQQLLDRAQQELRPALGRGSTFEMTDLLLHAFGDVQGLNPLGGA